MERATSRADNMDKPGNWTDASCDRQFIYWELIKACCLLHGYEFIDGIGIYDPSTGEVWTDPTRDELLALITDEPAPAELDTGKHAKLLRLSSHNLKQRLDIWI